LANTSSAQDSLRGCTMHVIIFYISRPLVLLVDSPYKSCIAPPSDPPRACWCQCTWYKWYFFQCKWRYKRRMKMMIMKNMKIWLIFFVFFFSSSFDRFSRPLQLILVLSYLHGTTNLHVFRPKSQLKRITFTIITNVIVP
jgi:hypothetical protein